MMHPMRFLLPLCVILGLDACSAAPPADGSLTETEVIEAIQTYDRAWSRRDSTAVAKLLDASYVYFSSVGDVRGRGYILGDLLGNPTYQLISERSELQVQLHGNTAVVGSRWRGSGTYEGEPVQDDQRCSLVLTRRGEALRIVSEHCTQISTS